MRKKRNRGHLMTPVLPVKEHVEHEDRDFVVWSKADVQRLKLTNKSVSPWWVIRCQLGVGFVLIVGVWLQFGSVSKALSMAWGVAAVLLPSAIGLRGMTSKFARTGIMNSVVSFFIWELTKVLMTLSLLYLAQRNVEGLSWPIMLTGLVVTLKVVWLALALAPKDRA